MKKTLILFIGCIILLTCGSTFGKGKGKPNRPGKSTEAARFKNADVNDPNVQARAEKVKQRRQQMKAMAQERAKASTKKAVQATQSVQEGTELRAGKEKRIKQKGALTRRIVHEEEKHEKRQAKLERIRKLGEETGDEKILARANKLIKKEQGRYDKKMQRLLEKLAGVPSKEEVGKKTARKEKELKEDKDPEEKDSSKDADYDNEKDKDSNENEVKN